MLLKQLTPIQRIIFLRKFIEEIIINSKELELAKKQIEIEKLRKKFLAPIGSQEKAVEKTKFIFKRPVYAQGKRMPIFYRLPITQRQMQFQKPIQKPTQPIQISPQIKALTTIKPEPQLRPEGFFLGKLEPLLKNATIHSIECPGPGKNLLVKIYDKINVTKINLSQSEINDIINNFAQKARIPVAGGILKAAVGDLVISAVISEFVGSRFIINRITPFSMIM